MKENTKIRAVPGFPDVQDTRIPGGPRKITIQKCSCEWCSSLGVTARPWCVTTPWGGHFHTTTWNEARRAAFNIAGGKK